MGLLTLFQLRGQQELPYRAMTVAYEHHMKCDLTGYPKNVRPRTLSIFSKIVAVADGFDAATSRRVVSDRCRCRRRRCSRDARQPAPRLRFGRREGVHQPARDLSGRHARCARYVRARDRALGESEPRGRVASDRANRQRRARQRRIPGAQRRSRGAERGRRVSSARSSRPKTPTVMASTSATTSSDALDSALRARCAMQGAARSSATSPPAIPIPATSVALLRGDRRRRRRRHRGRRSVLRSHGGWADHPGELTARARPGHDARADARRRSATRASRIADRAVHAISTRCSRPARTCWTARRPPGRTACWSRICRSVPTRCASSG